MRQTRGPARVAAPQQHSRKDAREHRSDPGPPRRGADRAPAALGLDLEAVELTPAGKRRLLRVAVDKDGGVTLDDVADATARSRGSSTSSDVMGEQPYTLEVTSPRRRPAADPAPALAAQRRPAGQGHARRRRGRDRPDHRAATSTRVALDVDGHRQPRSRYADVAKAQVQIEFNRKPRRRHEETRRLTPWTST